MRNVMTKAWEIARKGVKKFGGKAIEYISESLRIAWALVKKGGNKMVEMKGSEKQIKWANDVYPKAIEVIGEVIEDMKRSEEHTSELQSRGHLVCRLLLEKKKIRKNSRYK